MKMLRRKQMLEKTGLKATTQWRLEKQGQFPSRRMISKGLCGWLESEVDEWIESRREINGNNPLKHGW